MVGRHGALGLLHTQGGLRLASRRLTVRPQRLVCLVTVLGLMAVLGWTGVAFPFTEKQALLGHQIFALNCAVCHGKDGRGKTVPVGDMKGRKTPPLLVTDTFPLPETDTFPLHPRPYQKSRKLPFRTAFDIYQFLNGKHPPGTPKLYFEEHFWAIIALFLENRGVPPDGVPLNAEIAKGTLLHPPGGGQKVPQPRERR